MSLEGARRAPGAGEDVAALVAARLGCGVDRDRAACEAWALAGVVPALVARPTDAAEVAAMVTAVAEADGALVPLGRGAHRGLGHPPARYDVALVCDRLTRVCDYTPHDMTVTVEAGATLADVAALLAGEGQWLPLDPPVPHETTVGGLLAADLAGSLAASQGRVRDYVIGIAVVTAAGVPARAGGRVVKNVAGYDLMKLFIGSLGTLAVSTEVTFKVRPLPEAQRALGVMVADLSAACALGAAVAEVRVDPLAVTVTADAAERARVIVRLGGTAADVDAARARLLALPSITASEVAFDAEVADPVVAAALAHGRDFSHHAAGDVVVRLATLPTRLPALVAALAGAAAVAGDAWHADLLRGIVMVAFASDAVEARLARLDQVARAHGAHLVLERWPLALAPTVEVWRPLPPALPLMRRMKLGLDPRGTLAPGRFVGRL